MPAHGRVWLVIFHSHSSRLGQGTEAQLRFGRRHAAAGLANYPWPGRGPIGQPQPGSPMHAWGFDFAVCMGIRPASRSLAPLCTCRDVILPYAWEYLGHAPAQPQLPTKDSPEASTPITAGILVGSYTPRVQKKMSTQGSLFLARQLARAVHPEQQIRA